VRKELFEGILYKSISWFDNKDKAPGILSNILSEDVSKLNGLTSETIAVVLESFLTLATGIAISFYFSWRVALVGLGCSPFMIVGAVMASKLQWKANMPGANSKQDYYKETNALLTDIIMNYRTVISFG
jgi:ABC-type multidrug transport system fused ATPase/permease subunit